MKIKLLFVFALFLGVFASVSSAQVTVAPFVTPAQQFFDNNGNPLAGGKVCTFAAGTTTPLASYSDNGITLNANPVVLDSAGRGVIYLTAASYKIVIAASTANSLCSPAIKSQDQVSWVTPLSSFSGIISTGPVTVQPSTAATGGANQNSPNLCINGFYFNVTSLSDQWCFSDVLGAGATPTSTLTLTHTGSGGATALNFAPPLSFNNTTITNGTLNGTFAGNPTFSGAATFSPGLTTLGSGSQALQGGQPTNVPVNLKSLETSTADYIQNPQAFFSRIDSTAYSVGLCTNGPLASCEQPIVRVTGTNATTGNIPGQVGLLVDMFGYKANGFTAPPAFANYEVGVGAQVQDAAVDNITNLRGANFIAVINGTPTHAGPGGFTRSAAGIEIDTNNNSSGDANSAVTNLAGNALYGLTLSHNGNFNATAAISVATSAAAGKGWRYGLWLTGLTDCGVCIYKSANVSPTHGIHIQTSGNSGIVLGGGTIGTNGEPSNSAGATFTTGALILDALGTNGTDENQDSNAVLFRAKSVGSIQHDWKEIHRTTNNLLSWHMDAVADAMNLSSTGVLTLPPSTGQVILPGGSATNPAVAMFNATTGIYSPAGGIVDVTNNGIAVRLQTNSVNVNSLTGSVGFGGAITPDSGIQRPAAGMVNVFKTLGAKDGIIQSGNTVRVASDFTTASATLVTITGLTWTVPALATNYSFHCALSYSQATAVVADAFGIQAATNAPTNIFANAAVQITVGPPATEVNGTLATLSTTTATNIVTFTPGVIGTNYTAYLDGTIENPASANTFNIMVLTGAGADSITVKRGSYCQLF